MNIIPTKPIELFCGTGGVGKTTLATSRALYLANQGLKVLLITIDPAKRLKEILGLSAKQSGQIETVSKLGEEQLAQPFDALLMSPTTTFSKIASLHGVEDNFENRILKVLGRPYGGMNEILSMVELNMQYESGQYDSIILDTPPGSHFIDFLDSCKKFQQFFDQKFIDVFKYLSERGKEHQEKTKLLTKFISTGISKLLGYFEKVTGAKFIEEFIQAVSSIYQTKDSFLNALKLQEVLELKDKSNWFLVTSSEHGKLQEAKALTQSASAFIHSDSFIAINKCLEYYLELWQLDSQSPHYDFFHKLKTSMTVREINLKSEARNIFPKIISFPEVLGPTPQEHVKELEKNWEQNV